MTHRVNEEYIKIEINTKIYTGISKYSMLNYYLKFICIPMLTSIVRWMFLSSINLFHTE